MAAPKSPTAPIIVENDAGDRLQLVDGAWKPLANSRAPGSSYLPSFSGGSDKSEDAYYRGLREKEDEGVRSARVGISNARRAEGLLTRQNTGGVFAVPVLGKVWGALDPEVRELDAIQAETARSKRQPGEGAISDFDAAQFLAMTYGRDKPTETNRALIQAQRLANDAALQKRDFSDWYFGTYGNTRGMSEAWGRYAQDNPIFDPASEAEGSPRLNTKRQQWREYFGSVRADGDRRPTQAAEDARRADERRNRGYAVNTDGRRIKKEAGFSSKLPPAQRNAAMMFRGSTAKSGEKGNPYVPTNAVEFKNIPVGAWFVDDDGKVYRKQEQR